MKLSADCETPSFAAARVKLRSSATATNALRSPSSLPFTHEPRTEQLAFWRSRDGKQPGDPGKLAQAVLSVASQRPPPRRFVAGTDAVGVADQRVRELQSQIAANRGLSTSLAFAGQDEAS